MSYSHSVASFPARGRINLNDPQEVESWSRLLGVTGLDLAIAVQAAGPEIADVALVLGCSWPPAQPGGGLSAGERGQEGGSRLV